MHHVRHRTPIAARPRGRRIVAALAALAFTTTAAACSSSSDAQDAVATSSPAATAAPASAPAASAPAGRADTTAETEAGSEVDVAALVGTFTRTVTPEEAEAAGADPEFIEAELMPDGLEIRYELTADGAWTLTSDYCHCGSFQRGDFGTYAIDDDGRLVLTSQNTESRGWSAVIDWTLRGDELELESASGRTAAGETVALTPIENVMTLGRYTRLSGGSGAGTTTLQVGATPGWESYLDDLAGTLGESSAADLALEVDYEWLDANAGVDVEQRIVEAVASGALDAGYVGTRGLSALGVTGFDALTAPFLVDSYEVQQAVLSSDLPARLLPSLDDLGVTGLALGAGPLRYPLGNERPFVRPGDYVGATFHTYSAPVNAATATALGATHTDIYGSERDDAIAAGEIDVTENSLQWMNEDRGGFATLGALWPGIAVLIVNPSVLDGLTAAQADALRSTAAATLPTAAAWAEFDEQRIAELCAIGIRLVPASDVDREALRAAVEPVYEGLRAEPATAEVLAEVEALASTVTPAPVTIPEGCVATSG